MVTSDLEVYAVYEAIVYSFVIEENGGDYISDLEIAYEDIIPEIDIPIRTGYSFLGWFEDFDLTVPFTTTHMPLGGMTIYAKWEINQYTISFVENGGTVVADITLDYGLEVIAPADPTQLAKDFLGWYIDPEFSELYVFSTMPSEDVVLYAKWVDTLYTISFVENGGSEIDDIIDIYQASISMPTEPTKDGYIFDGFYEDEEFTTPYVFDSMPLDGDIVYVKWLINEYELSYYSYHDLDIKLHSLNYHSIFVTQDNQVYTIGSGGNGQLGINATTNSTVLNNITSRFGFLEGEEVIFVEATDNASFLLTSLGRVFSWGKNDVGQLGDGTMVNKLVPTDITGLFNLEQGEIINQLSVSTRTAFAITSNHRVFAWGYNGYKALILPNVQYYQMTPADITDLLDNYGDEYIVMIAAGENYTFFMTNAQRVLAIGANWSGSLGNGSTTSSNTLVDITANFGLLGVENIVYIGAGYEFNGVLTETGRVFMWGRNDQYQLGIEILSEKHTPYETTSFFNLEEGEYIVELSIQYRHSVALTNLGRIFVWGDSGSYQTGTGSTIDVYAPIDLTASFRLFEDELIVSLGSSTGYANLVITSRGRFFAFGSNSAGGLLDSPATKYTPTLTYIRDFKVIGSDMFDFGETIVLPETLIKEGYSVEGFYMDSAYTIAYNLDTMPSEPKTIYVKWSINQYTITFESNGGSSVPVKTQSYGTYLSSPIPVKTGYTFIGWFRDVELTDEYIFAYMEDINMTLYAKWTVNTYNIQYYDVQADFEFVQLAPSAYFTIALTSSGQVIVWGDNSNGQLGNGTTVDQKSPIDITSYFNLYEFETIVKVDSGFHWVIVVTSLGRVFTWGNNQYGQLGNGNTVQQTSPVEITANFALIGEEKIVSVAGGMYSAYAITSTGRLFAWGRNGDSQIGDGTMVDRRTPKDITSYFNLAAEETISEIHTGNRSALAMTSLGRIFTWGYDGGYGSLARGTIYTSSIPFDVTANFNLLEGESITKITYGAYGGMVLTSDGRILGWGYNDYFELGTGDDLIYKLPIDLTSFYSLAVGELPLDISTGDGITFLLTSEGRVIAVGRNTKGAMATGDTINLTVLTDVTTNFNIAVGDELVRVIASPHNNFAMALTREGKILVWGNNDDGQLGDGTLTMRLLPIEIDYADWSYYNSSNFDYLESIVLIAEPLREGYVFDGWYMDKNLTSSFTLTQMPEYDFVLYAKWVPID